MDSVISAVEKAYAYKCDDKAALFPIVTHSFEDGVSEFDTKIGSMDGAGIFGMKIVSAFEGNDKYNLPRLTGTILIFDRETGMLKSMMDGGLITNMRTGAAGTVGCSLEELDAELLGRFFNEGVKSVITIGVMGDPTSSSAEKGISFFNYLRELHTLFHVNYL